MIEFYDALLTFINRYGWFVIGGLVGAVVHRIRNTMSIKQFAGTLGISSFVGLCVGILFKNYFGAPEEVIFVACSVSGVFSKDILNEIQQVIAYGSEWVRKFLKLKTDESSTK